MVNTDNRLSAEEGLVLVQTIVDTWTKLYEPVIQFSGRRFEDDALLYTVLFSMPTAKRPVPVSVLHVYFTIVKNADNSPTITAHFAQGDLKHQFSVVDEDGKHKLGHSASLGKGKFEKYVNRLIEEKTMCLDYEDLRTDFERTRLIPPETGNESDDSWDDNDDNEEPTQSPVSLVVKAPDGGQVRRLSIGAIYAESAKAGLATLVTEDDKNIAMALRNAGLPCYEKLSFAQLLFNIFDATDENDEGMLQHHEIQSLLIKTFANEQLGLKHWDMRVVTSTVHENEEGKIEYKLLVQEAPEIIESLRARRGKFEKAYPDRANFDEEQMMNGEGAIYEAVKLLYGDELSKSCELIEALEAHDPEGTKDGMMSRNAFELALLSNPHRFSPQEIVMIMQFMPQSDNGNMVPTLTKNLTFRDIYARLRCYQLHNGLVEGDTETLRTHLIILLRRNGLTEDEVMPLHVLKNVLLQADQLNLSRMQIHILLGLQLPNFDGLCSAEDFLTICASVIPRFFDPQIFLETAEEVKEELKAQQREREKRELAALSGTQEGGEEEQVKAVDCRAEFEKALIRLCQSLDEQRRGVLPLNTLLKALTSDWDKDIEGGLSKCESNALCAEIHPDENAEVAYVDHVRTWIPILIELRQNKAYQKYLAPDPFHTADKQEGIPLVDLYPYSVQFPIFPPEQLSLGGGGKRLDPSQLRVPGSKRPSKEPSSTRRKSTAFESAGGAAGTGMRRMSLGGRRSSDASLRRGSIENRNKSMTDIRMRFVRGSERRRRIETRNSMPVLPKPEKEEDDAKRRKASK